MKKRIAGILISILALSALSGCGKEKDISYVDEPATTSDAATASVLHRNYEVTDGLLTFTVDADVDTSLSAQSSPVVKVSRNDYTKDDMKRIADAIFDAGSSHYSCPMSCARMRRSKVRVPICRRKSHNITTAQTFHTLCCRNTISPSNVWRMTTWSPRFIRMVP